MHKLWTAGCSQPADSSWSSVLWADAQSEEQLIFFCRRVVSAAWSHPTSARRLAPEADSGATKGPKQRLMSAALKSHAFWGRLGRKNSKRLVTHESHTTAASEDLHTAGCAVGVGVMAGVWRGGRGREPKSQAARWRRDVSLPGRSCCAAAAVLHLAHHVLGAELDGRAGWASRGRSVGPRQSQQSQQQGRNTGAHRSWAAAQMSWRYRGCAKWQQPAARPTWAKCCATQRGGTGQAQVASKLWWLPSTHQVPYPRSRYDSLHLRPTGLRRSVRRATRARAAPVSCALFAAPPPPHTAWASDHPHAPPVCAFARAGQRGRAASGSRVEL